MLLEEGGVHTIMYGIKIVFEKAIFDNINHKAIFDILYYVYEMPI